MIPKFNHYHFDGFDFIPQGEKSADEIKNTPGWVMVVMDDGSVWQRTEQTEWEKIRDAQKNE